VGNRVRQDLRYKPFQILLGIGIVARILAMVLVFPAWQQVPDSVRYARVNPTGLFTDPWMPAGYPLFLKVVRAIFPWLWVTTAIQHLVGIGIGTILYLTMRRLGAKRWVACIPAGVVFLSGDLIWMEHQLMLETLTTGFLVAGLGCAVYGLVPRVDSRWIAASSALLMAAALTRNLALVALPVLVLCTAFTVRGSLTFCLRTLAITVIPAAVVFGAYFSAFEISGGEYLGMGDMSGWNLYARVGPFADCSKFTPPPGTKALCSNVPRAARDAPLGFVWDPSAVAPRLLGVTPATADVVGEFAREAIVHQPLAYLKEVVLESAKYVDPGIDDERPWSGVPGGVQATGLFAIDNPSTEEYVENELGRVYRGAHTHVRALQALATYESLFRLGGLLIAAFGLATIVGMFVATGPTRLAIFLFGITAILLYLIPIATTAYEVRYGLLPQPLLVVSGTLGFWAMVSRYRASPRFAVPRNPQLGDS
jgi:hypothetical protein